MSDTQPAPSETPIPPPVPQTIPETAPPSNRKLIIGVILIILAVGGGLGGYILYSRLSSTSQVSPLPSSQFQTYSKYGFSFQYPKGMTINERGLLDSTATPSSGTVIGEIQGNNYELILVAWLHSATVINLDATLQGAFTGMAQAQGVTSVVKGQQGQTTKTGYSVLYQYFTITAGGRTSYGVYSVWYSTGGQRLYQLALTYYNQNDFSVYQRYLASFTETQTT